MKEFMKTKTVTYNLMSFTGFKALYFFSLLLEAPRSYEEINEAFMQHEFIKESISIDTFRVYLTSLKRAGCEIIKTRRVEGGKYKMLSHPFQLKISDDQVKSLVKIYKMISKNIEVDELVILDNFLQKLTTMLDNEKLVEAYETTTAFKGVDKSLTMELYKHCRKKSQITILYNSPRNGQKEFQIITDKVEFSNGKLYLYGTGLDYKQYTYFPVGRILKVLSVSLKKSEVEDIKTYKVGYELSSNSASARLCDEETIKEIKDDNTVVVEYVSSNLFMIKQKILSYGSSCKVLYPEFVKDEILQTLNSMKAGYLNGKA